MSQRILCIDRLILKIPDTVESQDGRRELTIDEALEWYLQYRKTQEAAIENGFGNFKYFSCNYPVSMLTEMEKDAVDARTEALSYLLDHPELQSVGWLASLIYDDDLGAYRNCYTEAEMEEYNRKMHDLKESKGEA